MLSHANSEDPRFDRDDVRVHFSQGLPAGYTVWWLASYGMYYWHRDHDDHIDGPYCDRFMARRGAVADSKQPE